MARFLMYRATLDEDPEARYTQSGSRLVNVRLREEKGADTYRMTAWEPAAETLAALHAGDVVTVSGTCKWKPYTNSNGDARTLLNWTVDCVEVNEHREVEEGAPAQAPASPDITDPFADQ